MTTLTSSKLSDDLHSRRPSASMRSSWFMMICWSLSFVTFSMTLAFFLSQLTRHSCCLFCLTTSGVAKIFVLTFYLCLLASCAHPAALLEPPRDFAVHVAGGARAELYPVRAVALLAAGIQPLRGDTSSAATCCVVSNVSSLSVTGSVTGAAAN